LWVIQAPEVNDIIWENLEIGGEKVLKSKLRTILILFLSLILITSLFVFMNSYKTSIYKQFPPSTSCKITEKAYADNDADMIKLTHYMAMRDKEDTLKSHGLGYYLCYCKHTTKGKFILNDDSHVCYEY